MATLAPPVAAIRVAVRLSLAAPNGDLAAMAGADRRPLALVACSGGADSLALAAAAAFVAPRSGWRVGLVTVDHGLQPGSAERAARVAGWAAGGFDPVEIATVRVDGPGGPEAAARTARYAALVEIAQKYRASAILLGHTMDDQAETVLLALARGAGPRGLAGMPPSRTVDGVLLLRPLLAIGREQTRAACAALGLAPWDDPHNADPAYTRSRVRTTAVPALIAALGPDVVANLARTARLLAADNAVLDDLAARFGPAGDALDVNQLLTQPEAIRTRILRRWVLDSGVPPGALASRHLDAIDALITRWHGQGTVSLPGGVGVTRRGNSLMIGGN